MGPPPFSDGNYVCEVWLAEGLTGFNGATAFQRWKRGPVPPEAKAPRDASMGPPPFSDGNLCGPCRRQRGRRGFNGATAFQRWKRSAASLRSMAAVSFNGATAFQRWKRVRHHSTPAFHGRLQWGHRLSAMETCAFRQDQRVLVKLQWGHRLSAMETRVRPRLYLHRRSFNGATAFQRWKLMDCAGGGEGRVVASMGPPPFSDGNHHPRNRVLPLFDASMGPPPFSDGNGSSSICIIEKIPGFNGATAFQRWKLEPVVGGPAGIDASMGPPPFSDGNCRGHGASHNHLQASMGPPPFSDGNSPPAHQHWRGRNRFNGATAFQRWKPWLRVRFIRTDSKLQWGHRLSAMETLEREIQGDGQEVASMGPPPFSDGNWLWRSWSGMLVEMLQWGHRLSAMETRDGLTKPTFSWWLQWGHRLSAMETGTSHIPAGPPGSRFNGATAFQRWKPLQRWAKNPPKSDASMGPPPFSDGNKERRTMDLSQRAASMGPPPFSDGNCSL